jgi:hypothetical protein
MEQEIECLCIWKTGEDYQKIIRFVQNIFDLEIKILPKNVTRLIRTITNVPLEDRWFSVVLDLRGTRQS